MILSAIEKNCSPFELRSIRLCFLLFIIGNDLIEAGELDSFLKDLCEELGAEVGYKYAYIYEDHIHIVYNVAISSYILPLSCIL